MIFTLKAVVKTFLQIATIVIIFSSQKCNKQTSILSEHTDVHKTLVHIENNICATNGFFTTTGVLIH